MREEFERLPEISWRLKQSNHRYNAQVGLYEFETDFSNEHYVNGAWYAYQEQQNKLNGILDLACKLQYSSGERIYNEIKELLK